MLKLFDEDFFKLLIGFLFILVASFGVFYVIAQINNEVDQEQVGTVEVSGRI